MVGHLDFEFVTNPIVAVAGTAFQWMMKGRSQPRNGAFFQNVAQGTVSQRLLRPIKDQYLKFILCSTGRSNFY